MIILEALKFSMRNKSFSTYFLAEIYRTAQHFYDGPCAGVHGTGVKMASYVISMTVVQ